MGALQPHKPSTGPNNPANLAGSDVRTPGGLPVYPGMEQNPFWGQLIQSGLFDKGLIPSGILSGGRTEAGGALGQLQTIMGTQAAGEFFGLQARNEFAPQENQFQQDFLKQYGPGQIETAGMLAGKDIQELSKLPQYADFFKTQSLLQSTAQAGLEGLGGAGGPLPSAVDKAINESYAQGVAKFGGFGQPGIVDSASTGLSATKALLGEQIRGSRINQALGVNQGFRMPGSLLGSVGVPNVGFGPLGTDQAANLFQLYKSGKMADIQRRDSITQGYGSLLGQGLNLGASFFL